MDILAKTKLSLSRLQRLKVGLFWLT